VEAGSKLVRLRGVGVSAEEGMQDVRDKKFNSPGTLPQCLRKSVCGIHERGEHVRFEYLLLLH
jgi:hypothetical protein